MKNDAALMHDLRGRRTPMAEGSTISHHDECCEFCGAMPDEPHVKSCPDYEESFDDVLFCDACGVSFTTNCNCDGREER